MSQSKFAQALAATVGLSVIAITGTASAAAFKPKFYAECYQPVSEARAMVESPPMDVAGTADTAGKVAGALGSLGGFGGLGGLGSLGKAASTAATVSKYSGVVTDVAQFTTKMQQDYPDPAARIAAYGDRMGKEADTAGEAAMKVEAGLLCYEKAHADLQAGVASGEIKARDATARQKEIQTGMKDAGDVLSDARANMDINIKAYNEALNSDSQGIGLNLASLGQAASAAKLAGIGGKTGGGAGGNDLYAAYYTQTNAYTTAWQQTYAATGDGEAANAAALAAANGTTSVKGYQQAYWKAQASGATASLAPAAANLGTLQALSQIGGFGGLSGAGGAWVAANMAAGVAGNAVSGANAETQPAAPAAAAANVGQAVGMANTLRGLSGGGGAWVAANMAASVASNAATTATPETAPTELSDAMVGSLLKTSVDTEKFTAAYGVVNLQNDRHAALSKAVATKLK